MTSYKFSSVPANHTIAASFAIDTFTITATAGSNGSISPAGTVTVNRGTSRPSRSRRERLPRGERNGGRNSVGAVTTYTFSNVAANHTIAATFAIDTFAVTASAGSNGTISPTAETVNHGTSRPSRSRQRAATRARTVDGPPWAP